jgi:hypothetical protein
MRVDPLSLDDVVAGVASGSFAYSRWGDSEWYAVLGVDRPPDVNGVRFSPELTAALVGVLEGRPDYPLGMGWLGMQVAGGRAAEWLADRGLDLRWVSCTPLLNAADDGTLGRVVAAARGLGGARIAAGPLHLAPVYRALGWTHVVVPSPPVQDAFRCRRWIHLVVKCARASPRPPFVALSAGVAANLAVDRLWRELDRRVVAVDFGSAFDPFAGLQSRTHMKGKRYDLADLLGD